MPYPNEHSCRLADPKQFIRFRRNNKSNPHRIYGFKKRGGAVQAYRYPTSDWTAGRARAHCKEHGGKFEAAGKPKESKGELVRIHRWLHEQWDGSDETWESHLIITAMMEALGVLHEEEDDLDADELPPDYDIDEVIRKVGNKWVLFTKDGSKKLGEYDTRAQALKRLRQVEFFKKKGS